MTWQWANLHETKKRFFKNKNVIKNVYFEMEMFLAKQNYEDEALEHSDPFPTGIASFDSSATS